ncbi:uncharacterized protein M6B38_139665 [Iris pallida]|uniref:Uncharacterized protein n=1 Tax=Iris pallida TaxID=29817 RepID=A0AAX6FDI0_IRIPA|nr:uncharacterized protein M6B38_139665 [Iris pallida]
MANFIPKFDREFRVGHASGGCSSSSNDERRCRRSESPSRPPPPQPLGHPLDRGHHPHHRALQPQVGAPRPHQPQNRPRVLHPSPLPSPDPDHRPRPRSPRPLPPSSAAGRSWRTRRARPSEARRVTSSHRCPERERG